MDELKRIGEKENVKEMGVSPYARKKKSTVPTTTVRVSLKNRDTAKIIATKEHITIYDFMNKLIEDYADKYNESTNENVDK